MDAKTLCLGTLILGDASGYEIKKMFEDGPFAHFQDVGYGSIYPALAKLLAEGLVTEIKAEQEAGTDKGHPDKKIYGITETGRDAFRQALAAEPGRDKIRSDAAFMMFFSEFLDPIHLRQVFEDYLEHYKARASFMRTLDPTGIPEGRLFARGLGQAFYDAVVDYMESNRDMILGPDSKPPLNRAAE